MTRAGRYALIDNGRIELAADPPEGRIDFWCCPREDEPTTWAYLPGQTKALCEKCGAVVVYRVVPGCPGPDVPKLCGRCVDALVESTRG